MEVMYQLERDDYRAYYQSVTRRLPPWKRVDFLPLIALSALIAYDHWSPNTRNGLLLAVVAGVGFFGLLFGVTLWREKEVYLKAVELHPGAIGLHTVLLHPAGCSIQSDVIEIRTSWVKVTELRQNDKLIVFLFSPRYGFFVPKRAFQTPEQAQAFLETAQTYRKSALDGTTPVLPSAPETWPPAPQRIV